MSYPDKSFISITEENCVIQAIVQMVNGRELNHFSRGLVKLVAGASTLTAISGTHLYVVSAACQWDHLPKDFAPFTTVHYHLYRLRDSASLDIINEALVAFTRLIEGSVQNQ